jgi:hypothetical protein
MGMMMVLSRVETTMMLNSALARNVVL